MTPSPQSSGTDNKGLNLPHPSTGAAFFVVISVTLQEAPGAQRGGKGLLLRCPRPVSPCKAPFPSRIPYRERRRAEPRRITCGSAPVRTGTLGVPVCPPPSATAGATLFVARLQGSHWATTGRWTPVLLSFFSVIPRKLAACDDGRRLGGRLRRASRLLAGASVTPAARASPARKGLGVPEDELSGQGLTAHPTPYNPRPQGILLPLPSGACGTDHRSPLKGDGQRSVPPTVPSVSPFRDAPR